MAKPKLMKDGEWGGYSVQLYGEYGRDWLYGRERVLLTVEANKLSAGYYRQQVEVYPPWFRKSRWADKVDRAAEALIDDAIEWVNRKNNAQRITDGLTASLRGLPK